MLTLGSIMCLIGVIFRGYLYPAEIEYIKGGSLDEQARIFRNGINFYVYSAVEGLLRYGGSFLVIGQATDFSTDISSLLIGGFLFGLVAFFAAPFASYWIARKLYPWFGA